MQHTVFVGIASKQRLAGTAHTFQHSQHDSITLPSIHTSLKKKTVTFLTSHATQDAAFKKLMEIANTIRFFEQHGFQSVNRKDVKKKLPKPVR